MSPAIVSFPLKSSSQSAQVTAGSWPVQDEDQEQKFPRETVESLRDRAF